MASYVPRSPCCYWFTGLPAAGKSTLANRVQELLLGHAVPSSVLDGDVLRTGLNSDLGFSATDRAQSVRRASEVARLMVEAELVTLVSLVSPYRADRLAARQRFAPGRFFEVYVKTDLQTCVTRDPKGLYRRAMTGDIPNLTGWNDPYEEPDSPDFVVETPATTVEVAAQRIVHHFLQGAPVRPVVHPSSQLT
ncbi:MAG: adenylyl-sulfate kinase [Rhodoferax sp.]|nr:adenylyl-sulfate kinase [Rhodoferax sp.]